MTKQVYIKADEYIASRRLNRFSDFVNLQIELSIREAIEYRLQEGYIIDKIYLELDEVFTIGDVK